MCLTLLGSSDTLANWALGEAERWGFACGRSISHAGIFLVQHLPFLLAVFYNTAILAPVWICLLLFKAQNINSCLGHGTMAVAVQALCDHCSAHTVIPWLWLWSHTVWGLAVSAKYLQNWMLCVCSKVHKGRVERLWNLLHLSRLDRNFDITWQ